MAQADMELVRRAWDAWLAGDLPGLLRFFDPEVVFDTSHYRDWPEASYTGMEGIERFLTEWLEVWDDYEATVERRLTAPDGRIVTLYSHRGRGRDSGLPMHSEPAQIATVRDGVITRLETYDDREEAMAAVGLRG